MFPKKWSITSKQWQQYFHYKKYVDVQKKKKPFLTQKQWCVLKFILDLILDLILFTTNELKHISVSYLRRISQGKNTEVVFFLKSVQMMSIFDHLKTKQVLDFNLEEKSFQISPFPKVSCHHDLCWDAHKKVPACPVPSWRKGQWEGADIHRILSLYWNLPNDSKL